MITAICRSICDLDLQNRGSRSRECFGLLRLRKDSIECSQGDALNLAYRHIIVESFISKIASTEYACFGKWQLMNENE